MKPKLLDRYVFSQFLRAFFYALTGLILIFVFINFLDYLRIQSQQSKTLMYLALLYSVPQIAVLVIPASLMFSVSYVVSSMTYDREMVAIYSSGVSFYRTIAGILIFSVVLGAVVFLLQNFVVIDFNRKANLYLQEYKKNLKDYQSPKEMVFQYNFKGKDSYYFISYFHPQKKEVQGGFHIIQTTNKNGMEIPQKIIEADRGYYDETGKKWILSLGREVLLNENLEIIKVEFFAEKEFFFEEDISFFEKREKEPSELNLWQLREEIELRKKYSLDTVRYEVYFHASLSFPFITIITAFIGAITGASGSMRDTNPFVKSLLYSTILIFSFQILYRLGISLGEEGVIPPFLAGWYSSVIFAIVVLVLIRLHNK